VFAAATISAAAQVPAFEVASMKPSAPGVESVQARFQPGGGFRSTNSWLKLLIQVAYSVRDSQVTNAPAWLESERFDIQAKAGAAATRDDVRLMLQTLLVDRCHLKLHRETRMIPAYSLEVSKNGPRIHALQEGEKPRDCGMGIDKSGLHACGVEMGDLAFFLDNLLHVPVADHTGLTGKFDLRVDFDIGDIDGTLIPALEEQLALKLMPQKAPLEILVIDSIERPAAN
jgi:uncharacterized protein (TIGR03435 family)